MVGGATNADRKSSCTIASARPGASEMLYPKQNHPKQEHGKGSNKAIMATSSADMVKAQHAGR